jgi:hypothetical protein
MKGSASFESPKRRHPILGFRYRSVPAADPIPPAQGHGMPDGHRPKGVDMQYSYLELATTRDNERVRRLDRRLDTERALREPVIEPVVPARQVHDGLWLRLLDRIRPEHSLTTYACRLPSGDMGRTAIKFLNGEWTAVCVPDPRARTAG